MVVVMTTMPLSLDTSFAVNNIFRKEFMLPAFLQHTLHQKYRNKDHYHCTVVPDDKKSYILYYKNIYKRIYQRAE
jgi:hypothetical protein